MDSIEYYNRYAAKIYEDTAGVDISDIMKEFLDQLEEGDTILDLGCGSERDNPTLHELGYDVIPLDASEGMYKLAEIHTGLDVLQMTFEGTEFEDVFDGTWACDSLPHVPKGEVEGALIKLADTLCARGVLYISVQKGDFEGFRGEWYSSDHTEDNLRAMLNRTGLPEITRIWETEDVCSIHPDTVWISLLARKK